MTNESNHIVLSPTVWQVIEQFVAAMRADAVIPDEAVDRLEKLLSKGTVPKPDDINAILFEPRQEGKA